MIEEFSSTIDYLNREIKKVNNQLDSLTWARLTWEQRVEKHLTIHANKSTTMRPVVSYIVTPINALFRRPIRDATLSQMQFATHRLFPEPRDN